MTPDIDILYSIIHMRRLTSNEIIDVSLAMVIDHGKSKSISEEGKKAGQSSQPPLRPKDELHWKHADRTYPLILKYVSN